MAKDLIIFDLYNTLITDDESMTRRKYRIDAIWSMLEKEQLPIRFKQIIEACEETHEYSINTLREEHYSYSVFELVRYFCAKLSLTDIAHLKKVHDIWAFASLQIPPTLLPNVKEGLQDLKDAGKKIALISNTGFTPGMSLRFFFQEQRIYDLFDDLVFSDEFGISKPQRAIFDRVLDRLKISPTNALFVGDHEFYDKKGANNAGMDYLHMSPDKDFRAVVREILSL
ncbi:MAG: HAD family hydrolase [Brevinema sp.]